MTGDVPDEMAAFLMPDMVSNLIKASRHDGFVVFFPPIQIDSRIES